MQIFWTLNNNFISKHNSVAMSLNAERLYGVLQHAALVDLQYYISSIAAVRQIWSSWVHTEPDVFIHL